MRRALNISGKLLAGCALAGLLAAGTAARADSFADLLSGGAGPGNYAVLGLANGTINLSLVTVQGNVGIAAGGSIINLAPSKIAGNVYESASGQYSGPGTLTGTTNINLPLLATNATAALTAASDAAAAAATLTFASGINSATVIAGVAGLNVIDVTGNINLNSANLTLSGPAGATFIINVSGGLSLVGTAGLMSAGVADSNILYNFTASNAAINTHIGDQVNGILLAAGSSSTMTLDGTFNGELIGHNISLLSNAVVNQPVVTPEPAALLLLGTGLLGLAFCRKRLFPA